MANTLTCEDSFQWYVMTEKFGVRMDKHGHSDEKEGILGGPCNAGKHGSLKGESVSLVLILAYHEANNTDPFFVLTVCRFPTAMRSALCC